LLKKLEEHIKIGAGLHPNNELEGNIDANLLDHYACQILALFFGRPFPILARGLRLALAIGRPRKILAIGDS
jgi:hypothetical protein